MLNLYYLVVGEKEQSNESVNVRTRDNKVHGEVTVAKLIAKLQSLKDTRALNDDGALK